MKKILLPTDFSDNSRKAIDYAIQFAGKEPVDFVFLYTYKAHSSSGLFISVERLMKKDAEQDMAALMREYEGRVPNNINLDFRIIRGDAAYTIAHLAEQDDYGLTILSTKGETGLAEVFVGSTTNAVIREAETPILAVPVDYQFEPIQQIALAIDGDPYSQDETLSVLKDLAKYTGATVFGLYISEDGAEIPNTLQTYFEEQQIPYEQHHVVGTNINESVNAFSQQYQIDIVCMIRRSRGFFQSLFHSSKTKKEVFNSDIPVLILHD